ncbi:MAG: hypothetical protein LC104_11420 [Bacteroidales bacterium]|nr:hypothetical protein [Bacteroidales bacterium]
MADRVFCIDFGSAFTKVALRADPSATTELIKLPGAWGLGGSDFCFPSMVAINRRDPANQRCVFGQDVVDLKTGNGIDVYRNWKKWLFQDVSDSATGSALSPLMTLLHSEEFHRLAASYGVSPAEGRFLRQIISAGEELHGKPATSPQSLEVRQQQFAGKLAAHYFTWLRKQVLEACRKLDKTGLRYEDIPARVTTPKFPGENPGVESLCQALKQAGWQLHPEQPVVTEPESNVIGVLTSGHNVITPKQKIQFTDMFAKGPFQKVLKDPEDHPAYRAFVVDIGAFTTDLAAFTLDTGGKTLDDPRTGYVITQKSVPIGISQLDEQIQAAVNAVSNERGEVMAQLTAADWEEYRRAVYAQSGKPFRIVGINIALGKGVDEIPIRETIHQFSQNIAAEVAAFCADHDPVGTEELILSGGGSMIPVVRDAVLDAATRNDRTFFRFHGAALPKSAGSTKIAKLTDAFARGGSALGGASLFFESSYY